MCAQQRESGSSAERPLRSAAGEGRFLRAPDERMPGMPQFGAGAPVKAYRGKRKLVFSPLQSRKSSMAAMTIGGNGCRHCLPFAKQGGTTEQFRPFGWSCFLCIRICCVRPRTALKEVTRLSYIDKVLSRLNLPGLILLIAGTVAVFFSGRIVEKIGREKNEKINLIIKAAGCFVAFAGALILLDVIG